ncbi:unnamed protein product [Lampetra planeri]
MELSTVRSFHLRAGMCGESTLPSRLLLPLLLLRLPLLLLLLLLLAPAMPSSSSPYSYAVPSDSEVCPESKGAVGGVSVCARQRGADDVHQEAMLQRVPLLCWDSVYLKLCTDHFGRELCACHAGYRLERRPRARPPLLPGWVGPPGSFDFLLLLVADLRHDIAQLQRRVLGHAGGGGASPEPPSPRPPPTGPPAVPPQEGGGSGQEYEEEEDEGELWRGEEGGPPTTKPTGRAPTLAS